MGRRRKDENGNNIVDEIREDMVELNNDSFSSDNNDKEILKENGFVEEGEKSTLEELNEKLKIFLKKSVKVESTDDSPGIMIPTGLHLLDRILGGGIPTKVVQLIGNPGSGKSALAGKIISAGQKTWGDKFLAIYIDTEQAITQKRLEDLGCKYPVTVINENITVEKVFEIIDRFCIFKEDNNIVNIPSCIIWDSVANTLSEKLMSEDSSPVSIEDKPKLLSFFLSKYVGKISKYNISLICINQLRDNIEIDSPYSGMKGTSLRFLPNKRIPGGESLRFNSSQILYIKQKDKIEEYGFKGIRVSMYTVKNRFFTPNIEIDTVYDFVRGFQNFWTDYEFLKKTKRITVSGGWVNLMGYSGPKCFQKDVLEKYKEDPEFKEVWNTNLKDALREEFSVEKLSSLKEDIL